MSTLFIQRTYGGDGAYFDGSTTKSIRSIAWESMMPNSTNAGAVTYFVGTQNLTTSPFPTFPNDASVISYYETSIVNDLIFTANQYIGSNYFLNATVSDFDLPITAEFNTLANVAFSGNYNDLTSKPSAPSQSGFTPSLVGNGATGSQASASKVSIVNGTFSTSATANISGSAVSTVTMKICSTNSATEANWQTVGVTESSQSYSLAVAIQGITGGKAQLSATVPAGWYYKFEASGSGTHTEGVIAGQITLFG